MKDKLNIEQRKSMLRDLLEDYTQRVQTNDDVIEALTAQIKKESERRALNEAFVVEVKELLATLIAQTEEPNPWQHKTITIDFSDGYPEDKWYKQVGLRILRENIEPKYRRPVFKTQCNFVVIRNVHTNELHPFVTMTEARNWFNFPTTSMEPIWKLWEYQAHMIAPDGNTYSIDDIKGTTKAEAIKLRESITKRQIGDKFIRIDKFSPEEADKFPYQFREVTNPTGKFGDNTHLFGVKSWGDVASIFNFHYDEYSKEALYATAKAHTDLYAINGGKYRAHRIEDFVVPDKTEK